MDDGAMFVITNRIYLNLMKRFKVPDKYYVSAEHSSKLSLTLQTGGLVTLDPSIYQTQNVKTQI